MKVKPTEKLLSSASEFIKDSINGMKELLTNKENNESKSRQAYFPDAGGWLKTRILERSDLTPGQTVPGPAIIADPDSTVVVPPGDTIEATPRGHLLIRISAEE